MPALQCLSWRCWITTQWTSMDSPSNPWTAKCHLLASGPPILGTTLEFSIGPLWLSIYITQSPSAGNILYSGVVIIQATWFLVAFGKKQLSLRELKKDSSVTPYETLVRRDTNKDVRCHLLETTHEWAYRVISSISIYMLLLLYKALTQPKPSLGPQPDQVVHLIVIPPTCPPHLPPPPTH